MENEYNEEYQLYRVDGGFSGENQEYDMSDFLQMLSWLIDKKKIIECGRENNSYYFGVLNNDTTITKYTIFDSDDLDNAEENKQVDLRLNYLFDKAKNYTKEVSEKRENMNKGFKNIFKRNRYIIINNLRGSFIKLAISVTNIVSVIVLSMDYGFYGIEGILDLKAFIIAIIAGNILYHTVGINGLAFLGTCIEIKDSKYLKEFDEKIIQEENYNKLISESKEKTNENNKNKYHEEIITKARELDELINKLSTENKKKYKSLIIEELNKYMESLNNSNKNEINLTLNTPDYTRIHCTIFLEGMKTEVLKLLEEEQHKNEINSLIEDINAPVILNIPSNKEKVKVKTNKNK